MDHQSLFTELGHGARSLREARGLSRRVVAEKAGLSERFLAEVETGRGNISIGRLADLATALDVPLAALVPGSSQAKNPHARDRVVALLGLRGAGKSSVGTALAKALGRTFIELDEEIERRAGLGLAEIFEMHGDAYYRRLEREVLRELLSSRRALVIATSGGIVSDAETWAMLRGAARTVWLRAQPEEHWDRVVAQGDSRPMADRPRAMHELRAILAARAPVYSEAEITVDTSTLAVSKIARQLASRLR